MAFSLPDILAAPRWIALASGAGALERALTEHGRDVTRAPTGWMPLDAPDDLQLLAATAHGRCLFTFNVRDFSHLARRHPTTPASSPTRWSGTSRR